jgi:hypothetical protein
MIKDILKLPYWNREVQFIGRLRNEKKFNLNDNVYILSNEEIIKCKIVGIELIPAENAEYFYKIKIPNEISLKKGLSEQDNFTKMDCSFIFSSIEEAKESALKKLEIDYKLRLNQIQEFFNVK